MIKFLISINNQYYKTSLYHNSIHGADVTQSTYLFFANSNVENLCDTKILDLLSIIIASLGHDVGHPEYNNTFLVNASEELALIYNDKSCLENFHSSKLFKTLSKTENNIFEKLTKEEYRTIRKRMISEILATDMAFHEEILSSLQAKITFIFYMKIINKNRKKLNYYQETKVQSQKNSNQF